MLALWHVNLEQGAAESYLYIYGVYNEQFRFYRPLVYNPLAVFRCRLVEGHLYYDGHNCLFVSLAQSDYGYDS